MSGADPEIEVWGCETIYLRQGFWGHSLRKLLSIRGFISIKVPFHDIFVILNGAELIKLLKFISLKTEIKINSPNKSNYISKICV
jgi:hypothetical protein